MKICNVNKCKYTASEINLGFLTTAKKAVFDSGSVIFRDDEFSEI